MVTEVLTDIAVATFVKGGVHPRGNKGLTDDLPIERLPLPHRVCLFLKQHVGAPCRLAVKKRADRQPSDALLFGHYPGRIYQQLVTKKDRVTEGDLIGSVTGALGASLHASISGSVQGIADGLHPMMGKSPAVVITLDPEAKPVGLFACGLAAVFPPGAAGSYPQRRHRGTGRRRISGARQTGCGTKRAAGYLDFERGRV